MIVESGTPVGVYEVHLIISDDNEEDPKSSKVQFRVVVKQGIESLDLIPDNIYISYVKEKEESQEPE